MHLSGLLERGAVHHGGSMTGDQVADRAGLLPLRMRVSEVSAKGHVPELRVNNSGEAPVLTLGAEAQTRRGATGATSAVDRIRALAAVRRYESGGRGSSITPDTCEAQRADA
jgi:hypothetical protein